MEEQELKQKSLEFDVSMSAAILYDYQIYNAFCKTSSGIVGTCFGLIAIALGIAYNYIIFIIMGAVLALYTPISLKMRCAQIMVSNETFKKPLHYIINENGITVSQGDVEQNVPWEGALKAVSTKQSIIVYTGKRNASVFPRKQLGENLPMLLGLIAEYMEPGRVKIRF